MDPEKTAGDRSQMDNETASRAEYILSTMAPRAKSDASQGSCRFLSNLKLICILKYIVLKRARGYPSQFFSTDR